MTIPEEEDKSLLNKLKTELPGILAWAVNGWLDWQKKGRRGETPGVVGFALSTPSQPPGGPLPLAFDVLLPGSGPGNPVDDRGYWHHPPGDAQGTR